MRFIQRLGIIYIKTKFKAISVFSKKKVAEEAFDLFCTPLLNFKRKVPPKNGERLIFKLNDISIKGYRWNHPQTNKVLILHGFNSAAYKFDAYVYLLINKGYEVLSFDAPAHGESEGKKTNAVEYSEMIKKIIELYGPIDNFIGHSFGGIALSLAMESLPHTYKTKLVFIAPATETTSAIDIGFALLNFNDKRVRKHVDKIILEKSGHLPNWFSIRRAVKNINANIFWIHDEDDDITPLQDALKVKEDNHANINFMITKGLGHHKIYHDDLVKKSIENFL